MSWYTIDLNCNECLFIVLQNTAVVFQHLREAKLIIPFRDAGTTLKGGASWLRDFAEISPPPKKNRSTE